MYREHFIWMIVIICNTFFVTVERELRHVTVLHTNDMESRYEEFSEKRAENGKWITGICKPVDKKHKTCFGGFAIIKSFFEENKAEKEPDGLNSTVFLFAGNVFTGSAWFSVHGPEIATEFIKILGFDAIALGNHEFDLGPQGFVTYHKSLQDKIVAANIDVSREPVLEGITIKKSVILDGVIGVIGYITPTTKKISKPGKVTFSNEIEAIKKEAVKLVQKGCRIIIALGNSGYKTDIEIAKKVELVDLVVGGHSHTFLYHGLRIHKERRDGPYPTIVKHKSGKLALVVTAYAYTKYVGKIELAFDNSGKLVEWLPSPILLDSKVPQDTSVLKLLEDYRPRVQTLFLEPVGSSNVDLTGPTECVIKECNIGNLITDALVSYVRSSEKLYGSQNIVALINGGGIKNSIEAGPISRGDLMDVLPFKNHIAILILSGSNLLQALEQMFSQEPDHYRGEFPQVSRLILSVDMSKKPYSRVGLAQTLCDDCPDYSRRRKVRLKEDYFVITNQFLANGGDGITILKEKAKSKQVLDVIDLEIVIRYIRMFTPISPRTEGRITIGDSGNLKVVSDILMFVVVIIRVL